MSTSSKSAICRSSSSTPAADCRQRTRRSSTWRWRRGLHRTSRIAREHVLRLLRCLEALQRRARPGELELLARLQQVVQTRLPLGHHLLGQPHAELNRRDDLANDRVPHRPAVEDAQRVRQRAPLQAQLPLARVVYEGPPVLVEAAMLQVVLEQTRVAARPDERQTAAAGAIRVDDVHRGCNADAGGDENEILVVHGLFEGLRCKAGSPAACKSVAGPSLTVLYGEAKGPQIQAGRTVRARTALCTLAVQSPFTLMHTDEWLGRSGCANKLKACHSLLDIQGMHT